MANEIINELSSGTVHITEDVIASIADLEAEKVEGVQGISSTFTEDMVEKFSGKASNKGIIVNIQDENVYLNIRINVFFGKNIIEICKEIQAKVKETVENMTGLNVIEVNISVESVVLNMALKEN